MATGIEKIEGIGPAYGEKLRGAGIKSVEDLLTKCGTRAGRDDVGGQTGISEKLLLDWANMADLMRIDGVGPEFAELLEAAGVDTVNELGNRNPHNLTVKLAETHATKGLTRAVPSEKQVERWIEEARAMTPAVSH